MEVRITRDGLCRAGEDEAERRTLLDILRGDPSAESKTLSLSSKTRAKPDAAGAESGVSLRDPDLAAEKSNARACNGVKINPAGDPATAA